MMYMLTKIPRHKKNIQQMLKHSAAFQDVERLMKVLRGLWRLLSELLLCWWGRTGYHWLEAKRHTLRLLNPKRQKSANSKRRKRFDLSLPMWRVLATCNMAVLYSWSFSPFQKMTLLYSFPFHKMTFNMKISLALSIYPCAPFLPFFWLKNE